MRKLIISIVFIAACLGGLNAFAQDSKPADIAGNWIIELTFIVGKAQHTAEITQEGEKLSGTYHGEHLKGTLSGSVNGNTASFSGRLRNGSTGVSFRYTGTIDGDTMKGTVNMGEYWNATFTAKKKK